MEHSIDIKNLKRCVEISRQSRESGNTPFGALLADKDGNILLEQPNIEITENKCTGHAETQVAERASQLYTKDYLKDCTLYTTAEPCAMCAGAIYWAGIGRVVYGMTEKDLLARECAWLPALLSWVYSPCLESAPSPFWVTLPSRPLYSCPLPLPSVP